MSNGNLLIPPLFPNYLPALSGVGAVQVNIPDNQYEFARGDNITLPCNFVPSVNPTLVILTWSVEGKQANVIEVSLRTCVLLDVHVALNIYHKDNHCA